MECSDQNPVSACVLVRVVIGSVRSVLSALSQCSCQQPFASVFASTSILSMSCSKLIEH